MFGRQKKSHSSCSTKCEVIIFGDRITNQKTTEKKPSGLTQLKCCVRWGNGEMGR
ncbi:MAG: hypothetical protein AAGJ08_09540 [Cyanobacteria bacterium P01_H01_bin.35]